MLVIPLKNHLEEVIGVLQLINAQDEETGEVIPFDPRYQSIVRVALLLAAIALTNMQLIQEIELLFESFVRSWSPPSMHRPPITPRILKSKQAFRLHRLAINQAKEGPLAEECFDDDRLKVLVMAGWLHDIGKVATPLKVMNKATRLDEQLPLVVSRIDYALQKKKMPSCGGICRNTGRIINSKSPKATITIPAKITMPKMKITLPLNRKLPCSSRPGS